jgi:hypothetical protein
MRKKEVTTLLNWGNSHTYYIEEAVTGVTKFQVFLAIKPLLKGKLYWYALRNGYDCSDNLFHYRKDIKLAFTCKEPEREYLMNLKERRFLENLPERITIYRGMTENELKQKSFGCSWTLKKEVAEFFANTYQRNYATNYLEKVVYELTINKSEVIAFFNQREEFEIIYIKDNGNKS